MAEFYVEAFDIWAQKNMGLPSDSFTWEKIISPREYNFTTDRLFVYVPESVIKWLFERSEEENHVTLRVLIKEMFTSYDGFMSFYDNDLDSWLEKPLEAWDHNELGTLIASVIASENYDKNQFQMEIYALLFSGNGEEDEAWAMDWPKFKEKVGALRAKKLEEHNSKGLVVE